MIPQEYIQEVVARNDITEVIGQYVQLRHRGRTYTGLCPFHNEKTPSFTVYPDTQSFYCFGCGAAGDVINFVRKISNLGYAPEDLVGLLHYLRHRGFTEPELESSGLVKRSAKGNLYDIFRHRVMVPIIDVRGNIIAFGGRVMDDSKPKYINSPETRVYHKSRTLLR